MDILTISSHCPDGVLLIALPSQNPTLSTLWRLHCQSPPTSKTQSLSGPIH
jgi:hypothetical protein